MCLFHINPVSKEIITNSKKLLKLFGSRLQPVHCTLHKDSIAHGNGISQGLNHDCKVGEKRVLGSKPGAQEPHARPQAEAVLA